MIRRYYKYRIYPNTEQKIFFAKCFGCVRFFYNKSILEIIEIYKNTGKFKNITPATYKNDYQFLKEVDSLALSNAQLNRNQALKNFFFQKSACPKLKSKRNKQTYTTNNQGCVKFSDNNRYISIPKCKRIRIKKHRDFKGTMKSITVSMTADNKYYISLLVEENTESIKLLNNSIGLDLGLKNIIVDSNGRKYKNHKYLKTSLNKLSREQRKLSKMVNHSNNQNKQRIKVARLYSKISNQRNDYLHKLSKTLIDENQIICIENLKIKRMVKEKKLARSIADASWYKLVTMLVYKSNWYGNLIVKVPIDYPSSQLCSVCSYKNSITKNLSIRRWVCPNCGTIHDRDINAAKNILSKGIEMLTKDGTHPDSSFMLGSMEPSSEKLPHFN